MHDPDMSDTQPGNYRALVQVLHTSGTDPGSAQRKWFETSKHDRRPRDVIEVPEFRRHGKPGERRN